VEEVYTEYNLIRYLKRVERLWQRVTRIYNIDVVRGLRI